MMTQAHSHQAYPQVPTNSGAVGELWASQSARHTYSTKNPRRDTHWWRSTHQRHQCGSALAHQRVWSNLFFTVRCNRDRLLHVDRLAPFSCQRLRLLPPALLLYDEAKRGLPHGHQNEREGPPVCVRDEDIRKYR